VAGGSNTEAGQITEKLAISPKSQITEE